MPSTRKAANNTLEAAARTEESSNAVRVEQEASKEFRGLCQHAFLGRAKLKITLTRNKLMMRTYNPGRQVEQELVRYMVGMMSSGDCRSDSNPLTIAVDGGLIDQRTLTKEAGELTEVRFLGTGSVTLELLAGMHRVLAAREASKALRGRLEKLEKQLGDEADGEAGDEEYVEGEDRPPRDRQQEERTAAVERQLEGLKGMIESVETWPIQFYDIGSLHRQCQGISVEHRRGRGTEVLLRFLAENTRERHSAKTSSEDFSDILYRQLYSPGPATKWESLIGRNRILRTVCRTEHIWELSTTAMTVSPGMQRSWVTQADTLRKVAACPSSMIVSSVTIHMLRRVIALFRPIPAPDNEETWAEVMAACTGWSDDKAALIRRWREMQETMEGTPGHYQAVKEQLLEEVSDAGKQARRRLRKVEKRYSEGRREGLEPSHVHVDEEVMADLDRIYLKHYSPDGPLALRRCFNMMSLSTRSVAVREKYQEYMADVEAKLQSLSSKPECSVRVTAGDLRAIGLKHAASKLGPLFGPVFGRICLPIPTKSMLDDLKSCLTVDGEIMAEVGVWFDGLGRHPLHHVKGKNGVDSWSEVIAAKLRSLCTMQTRKNQDDLILWVFTTLMTVSEHHDELGSELAMSGTTSTGDQRETLLTESPAVKKLSKELTEKLKVAKELRGITSTASDGIEWSAISSTGYNIRESTGAKLRSLCSTVVSETAADILRCRAKLLRLPRAAELRSRLWLDVNQWLLWYPSGHLNTFEYWDRLVDQNPTATRLYRGPKRQRIRELYQRDLGWHADLGNLLSRCPALCNNPTASSAERVISSEVKEAIDNLLKVSRGRLNRQRGLLCPADKEPEEGERDPFEDMPEYRYSQLTFKSFTEEEVRTQAGKEVLPSVGDAVKLEQGKGERADEIDEEWETDRLGGRRESAPVGGSNSPLFQETERRREDSAWNDGEHGGPGVSRTQSTERRSEDRGEDQLRDRRDQVSEGPSRANTPKISAKSAGKQRQKQPAGLGRIDSYFGPTSAQPNRRYVSESSPVDPEATGPLVGRGLPPQRSAFRVITPARLTSVGGSGELKRIRSNSVVARGQSQDQGEGPSGLVESPPRKKPKTVEERTRQSQTPKPDAPDRPLDGIRMVIGGAKSRSKEADKFMENVIRQQQAMGRERCSGQGGGESSEEPKGGDSDEE